MNLYNKMVAPTFIECPPKDPKIAGCITKFVDIHWDDFINFLKEKDAAANK